MLSEAGWLVLIWVVWTFVGLLTFMLIRLAMHGQQELVSEQEDALLKLRTRAPAATTPGNAANGAPSERPSSNAPYGPPLGAT